MSEPAQSNPENIEARDTTGTFIHFLRRANTIKDNTKNFPLIKVILGNITCDMDSAACALAYAFLLDTEASKRPLLCDKRILPVFNIKRSEIHLKTEVVYLLEKLAIPIDLIIMRDDISLAALANENKLELVLVDHHVLEEDDKDLKDSIVEIIDHRPEVHPWPYSIGNSLCTIELVGSCASLVTNEILDREPAILQDSVEVSSMLYGAVLPDTLNFSQESRRYTDLDVRIAKHLESVPRGLGGSRLEIYTELLHARTNVIHLSSFQILKKDVKLAGGNPVSTLPMLVQDFCSRPDAQGALHDLIVSLQNCEIVVLIGITTKGDLIRRDVGFYTESAPELCAKVQQSLLNEETLNLLMKEVTHTPEIPGFNIYNQMNVERTRKHILPIIEQALKSLKDPPRPINIDEDDD